MKKKIDEEDLYKYGPMMGLKGWGDECDPRLKKKPGRKPHKVRFKVEGLGELILNSVKDLCEYTGLGAQTIYSHLSSGCELGMRNIHIEYINTDAPDN